jgi:hypothetical protein
VAGVGCPSRGLALNQEKRGIGDGISTKPQEVLKTKLVAVLRRQKLRGTEARHLVSQGPEGIKPQGLVPRGIGDDIRVFPVGGTHIVIHGIEKDTGYNSARGNGSARVTRGGDVVEKHAAQGAVEEIKGLKGLYFFFCERIAGRLQNFRDIQIFSLSGTK